jgi:hypothetical protein
VYVPSARVIASSTTARPPANLRSPVSSVGVVSSIGTKTNIFGIISVRYCSMKRSLSEEELIKKLKQSEWYKSLSEKVRERVDAYPPTKKYKMKATGRIVTLASYDEDKNGDCNTVTVDVSRDDNPRVLFERQVFGVRFDELELLNPLENLKN